MKANKNDHIGAYLTNQSYMDSSRDAPRWRRVLNQLSSLSRPQDLQKLAADFVEENRPLFSNIFGEANTRVQSGEAPGASFTKDDIRRVVQRNILAEYDHPQIIEAVSDYLYHHFLMV